MEEPNAHLFLHPERNHVEPIYVTVPIVDEESCDRCGKCAEICQYNAIFVSSEKALVFPELCHSCGGCALVCPKKAISEEKYKIGALKSGSVGGLNLVYGELEIGEPMATPIIKEVKRQIEQGKDVIIDSPPGTSCPVIEAVRDSD